MTSALFGKTLKEQLFDIALKEGYDLFKAGEIADEIIESMHAHEPGTYSYRLGKATLTLSK